MDEQKDCPLCHKPLEGDAVSYVMATFYHITCLNDTLAKLNSGEFVLVNSVWMLEQRLHTIELEGEVLAQQMNRKQEEYNRLREQLEKVKEQGEKTPQHSS